MVKHIKEMKKLICKLMGHNWWYVFPSTPICRRCNHIPTHPIFGGGKEWDDARRKMSNNINNQ